MSSDSAGDHKKANRVRLLGYSSRYVTHDISEYITDVANSDDLTFKFSPAYLLN